MTYELTDEGLRTSDPVIGAMFYQHDGVLSKSFVQDRFHEAHPLDWERIMRGLAEWNDMEITIPYPLVSKKIKPVEGEDFLGLYDDQEDYELPWYECAGCEGEYDTILAPNALTFQRVGQLRELIERVAE